MLKPASSVAIAPFKASTYSRKYAQAFHALRLCWAAGLSIFPE